MSLQYDDGTVIGVTCPASALTNNAWNSGSSPIYRGTKWTPTGACRLVGGWIAARLPDNNVHTLALYAGTAAAPTVTATIDADTIVAANSSAAPIYVPLPPTALSASTVYRLVLEPTTANNNTTFAHAEFADADALAAFFGDLKGTTGVAGSPPTWTDYDNGTDGYRAYPIIPVIDDVTASGAGGLLTHPGYAGRV